MEVGPMQQRRRVKHVLTFEERLACQAERLRDEAPQDAHEQAARPGSEASSPG